MTAAERETLRLRPLEQRDLTPLAEALGLSQHHIQARWFEAETGRRTMLIAELKGALAGSVSFEVRATLPHLLHLFALSVVEHAQRHGIGTKLIAAVEEEARRRDLGGVDLAVAVDNVAGWRLYERFGYRQVGEPYTSAWTWHGANGERRDIVERCVRMVRQLAG